MQRSLGRLVAVHPISPAHLQRAVLLAALSFIFFTGMMFAYYLLQSLVYFLLATAFLVIYIATMYSFISIRRKIVEVYENGLRFGNDTILWGEVENIDREGKMSFRSKELTLPASLNERDTLIARIRGMLSSA